MRTTMDNIIFGKLGLRNKIENKLNFYKRTKIKTEK